MEQLQHCTDLPRQVIFPVHTERTGKDRARVGMNVTAHQEKEKNEKMKASKRKAGEDRRPAINFKKAVCCPSVVVQGEAQRKNEGECLG